MTIVDSPVGSTPAIAVPTVSDPVIDLLANHYINEGPNAEYQAFENQMQTLVGQYRRAADIWDFIDDAVTGKGGFSNGAYLFPNKGEYKNGAFEDKFIRRQQMADYNAFAGHICNAAWELIVSASDMIERKARDGSEYAADLNDLWTNCDLRGTSILDFLEYVEGQARRYSVGYIIVDRDDFDPENEAENKDPNKRPYLYAVPTRNVVDWKFDEDGRTLLGVVILEPTPGTKKGDRVPFRVWTQSGWAIYTPQGRKRRDYVVTATGDNRLGEVPLIRLYNEQPEPDRMFAATEMYSVARMAQTVYNIDSQRRDIELKCALFLSMPVRDIQSWSQDKAIIGSESLFIYDGEAGEPRYISPDLTIVEKLQEETDKKIESAYDLAHLRALVAGETVKTSSGFHAEVEFSKAERRVARAAAAIEQTEKQIALLYMKYRGIVLDPQGDDFTVTYPRDFGIRDMQKLIADVETILDMNVGEQWEREELTKLAKARFPRKTDDELAQIVDGAVKARSLAKQQQSAVDRVKALAAQAKPATSARAEFTAEAGAEMTAGGNGITE